MTREQLEQFVKEVAANTDYVFNEAAEKAGIDSVKLTTLWSAGILVLFQPKGTV
jgi:hypothetical protein